MAIHPSVPVAILPRHDRETEAVGAAAPLPVGLVGLDNLITVNGEHTTIRKEHHAGHATGMRVNDGTITGRYVSGHWALIDGQSFPVSADDHALLRD